MPWAPDIQAVYEHLHRYLWAARVVSGRRVLDLGSGDGFGSAILAERAVRVLGIDIDERAVEHARLNYAAENGNLEFKVASATDLSDLAEGSVDVVVAFEVIEHLRDQERMLAEITRVLAADGLLILSIRERRVGSEVTGYDNPSHARELKLEELMALLRGSFANTGLWAQQAITGSELTALELGEDAGPGALVPPFFVERAGEAWVQVSEPATRYLVAAASNRALPDLGSHSTLADTSLASARHSEQEIVAGNTLIAEGEARIGALYEQLRSTHRRLREVQQIADVDTSGLRATVDAERVRTDAMRTELLAKGDELAVIDRQRAEAVLALAAVEESVTWRALRRLSARLYSVLGGRNSSAARALSACVRLAGSALRPRGAAAVERPAARGGELQQDPIVFPVFAEPSVSLVIPLHRGASITRACLESIRDNTSGVSYEVILVDDDADVDTKELLEVVRGARIVVNDENLGYLRSVNVGAGHARGRWLVLCNNDIEVWRGWLRSLLACGESAPDIAVVAPRYLYPDGRLNEAGGIIWRDGTGANYGRNDDPNVAAYNYRREVDYGSAAALLVRAEVFSELGGYDERFMPMYYEDADLCFSVRQRGLRVMYEPSAVVVHVEGATAGTDPLSGHKRYQERNRSVFVEKWNEVLAAQHLPDFEGALRLAADRLARAHVLVIDHQLPTPDRDAGSVRMLGMIGALQSLGNQVSFLPDNGAAPQPYRRDLQDMGVEVLGEQSNLHAQLVAGLPRFKAVVVSRPGVAPRWLAMIRELAPSATVIYDTVDLHWIRESRALALNGNGPAGSPKVTALRELELAMVRSADATLVATEVERSTLLQEAPDAQVHVMPMIHEVAAVVPPLAGRRGIVFVGSFAHPPNADAAIHLVKDVMPAVWRRLPGLPVTIIGADPPASVQALGARLVEVTGWVEDISPLMHAARLLVAPLRFGAGMKGKVTHSLSLGLPVVTTPSGAEGLETGADAGVLVGEDPRELAELIAEVCTDDLLWRRMSRGGQASVGRNCSPAVARRVFELLLAPPLSSSVGIPLVRPRAL